MFRYFGALTFGWVLVSFGCGSDKSSPPAPTNNPPQQPAGDTDSGPKPPGRVLFDSQRCTDCHSINGSALTGKMKAPDLSHIGGSHPKDWIVAHIRDPKSHKPMSRMPAYGEDKLNTKDAGTMGDYLAGLK